MLREMATKMKHLTLMLISLSTLIVVNLITGLAETESVGERN